MLSDRFQAKWGHKNEQDRHDFFLHEAFSLASMTQPVLNLAEGAKNLDQRAQDSTILKNTEQGPFMKEVKESQSLIPEVDQEDTWVAEEMI